jgi:hypothetical protein
MKSDIMFLLAVNVVDVRCVGRTRRFLYNLFIDF